LKKRILAIALLSALVAFPTQAQTAADRTTARELAAEGQAAFERGDYETAADRFARADALVHAPTLVLALARAQVKLGKLVQAYEGYMRIIREGVSDDAPAVFNQAYDDAKQEVTPLKARLAWVTIQLDQRTPTARVTVDGVAVPPAAIGVRRAVNPGEHTILAEQEGFLPAEKQVILGEGEVQSVSLSLQANSSSTAIGAPGPAPAPVADPVEPPPDVGDRSGGSTTDTLGWVALGVGAAGLVVGGVAGVLAMSKHGDLEEACPDGRCPEAERDNLDGYRTAGTISTVGFIVGGVAAAAGVTLLLTAPKGREKASLELRVGPATVSAAGRF
jgi:hypothetical protein